MVAALAALSLTAAPALQEAPVSIEAGDEHAASVRSLEALWPRRLVRVPGGPDAGARPGLAIVLSGDGRAWTRSGGTVLMDLAPLASAFGGPGPSRLRGGGRGPLVRPPTEDVPPEDDLRNRLLDWLLPRALNIFQSDMDDQTRQRILEAAQQTARREAEGHARELAPEARLAAEAILSALARSAGFSEVRFLPAGEPAGAAWVS
jgi:hypothetical protein